MSSVKDISREALFSSEKMMKVGLFETAHLFCDLYCFEPGQEQKTHVHPGSDKIYCVLSGRGTFRIGQETLELTQGEMTIATAGQDHGVKNSGEERLKVLVFVAPRP